MKNQSLDQFIAKLLSDDDTLKAFLSDPTNGGKEHGITKAERAVLRRTVAHMSNSSKNGYTVNRDYGSYRRSLRMLQNVLHKHAGAHGALAMTEEGSSVITFHVYITNDPHTPGAPYDNPSLAYTNYVTYQVSTAADTIGGAMGFNPPASPSNGDLAQGPGSDPNNPTPQKVTDMNGVAYDLTYEAIYNNGWFVRSFRLVNLSNGSVSNYELDYNEVTSHEPFWYYSLDGQAIVSDGITYEKNPSAQQGGDAASFNDAHLNGSTSVYWQAIAPDTAYGFSPCFPDSDTSYIVLGLPVPNRPVVTPGNVFYQNTITNIYINPSVKQWILASETDGSGNLVTDDVVEIQITGTSGTATLYSCDYSNGCSGVITPTGPEDLTSALSKYTGQHVQIKTICKDQCGGVERSSGYILVPRT